MATNIDKEVILHYIERVHDNLKETSSSANRVVLWVFLLTIAIIALSLGLISTNQQISFGGITFSTTLGVLLIGAVIINSVLFCYYFSLFNYRRDLLREIINSYKSIGYENIKMDETNEHTIYFPNVLTSFGFMNWKSVKIKNFNIAIRATLFSMFLLSPLLTDAIACYKIIYIFGILPWGLIFLLICIVTISVLIIFILFSLMSYP